MTADAPASVPPSGPRSRAAWLLGAAVLAVVIAVVLHGRDERALAHLAARAEPRWLAVAAVLQAATYLAQALVWLAAINAARPLVSLGLAYRLSVAKLFVDQALPSGGLSGTVLMAKALERQNVPRPLVMASVVVATASYYLAYALALVAALAVTHERAPGAAALTVVGGMAVALALAVVAVVLAVPGRGERVLGGRVGRLPIVNRLFAAVAVAEPRLAHHPGLVLRATACQLAIVFLDAATLWSLLAALGERASASGVFASFVLASLVKTIGVLPAGLGLFEAASVGLLAFAGVPALPALSATLLFRGFALWVPLVPGLLLARRSLLGPRVPALPAVDTPWALDPDDIARRLRTPRAGLAPAEAAQRLELAGPNELREAHALSRLRVLWNQLRSPLLLLLVFAAGAAALTADWVDAVLILAILFASVGIGYGREYRAQSAAARLQARVRTQAVVRRDGRSVSVPLAEVVPGDLVVLAAGSVVPADAVLVEAVDCFANEAMLTGESFPVEKRAGAVAADATLRERSNCVYLGTNVRSGTATALVIATGAATELARIAHRLSLRPPEPEFDRGLRRFGYLLTTAMSIMVVVVFAANVLLGRPPIETLLFSIALAVGLSPELMPVILNVNLARGAQGMARHGVLVKRLAAIEDLGSMDVLCTDKTGTLTEGVVRLDGAFDPMGGASAAVLERAALNAVLHTGLANPLDHAILEARRPDLTAVEKVAEVPWDFVRKRVSVVVRTPAGLALITKGAFEPVLAACASVGERPLDDETRAALRARYQTWSEAGIRVLAVADRSLPAGPPRVRETEQDLRFVGFLTFLDRPKAGVAAALAELRRLGVSVKLISGDAEPVVRHVAASVGMPSGRVLTGAALERLDDEALWRMAPETTLFAEVDPNQKERLIQALRKMGHVVGFLGDGVNDAPAMHAADTSLSVDGAVDVAKEAADFVLLERDLDVIRRGIEEGRTTFANTLKYVLTTTSANLGNMLSMAAASFVLPFLPLVAVQILLNNLLSDVPAIGLADDAVDPELVARPRRWDMGFIGRFMVTFGLLSSLFDVITFGLLLGLFAATPAAFRTGWFVESLLTELVIALVVRTRRPCWRSRPGGLLVWLTALVAVCALALPYVPGAAVVGFVPLPGAVMALLVAITGAYVIAAEGAKRRFYAREA